MFTKQLLTIDRCTGVAIVLAAAEGHGKPRVLTSMRELHAQDASEDGDQVRERKMKLSALASGNVVDVRRQHQQRPLEGPRHR